MAYKSLSVTGVPLPPSTWCVWGKLSFFNGLEEWLTCKLLVFRNLEATVLKTENLGGLNYATEPSTTVRSLRRTKLLRTG